MRLAVTIPGKDAKFMKDWLKKTGFLDDEPHFMDQDTLTLHFPLVVSERQEMLFMIAGLAKFPITVQK